MLYAVSSFYERRDEMNTLERMHEIDVLRGFACLGLAFANIVPLSTPVLYDSIPSSLWTTQIDRLVEQLLYIFVHGNFYPLFSMLFGFSFMLFMDKAAAKGKNPHILFTRRQVVLLCIGAVHAFFIWYGDILIVYALFGFLLLPLYKASRKTISILLVLILLPNILILFLLIDIPYDPAEYFDYYYLLRVIENYQAGGTSAFLQNYYDWLTSYQSLSILFLFINIFPMFLIGVLLAKSKSIILHITKKHVVFWLLFGVLGVFIKISAVFHPNSLLFLQVSDVIGNPLMSLFYGLSILLFMHITKNSLIFIRYVGRMAITNYLMQNIIGLIIFRLFHLYGILPPSRLIIISLAVAVCQIGLSYLWLQRFKQGPIEIMWRKLTYFKI